MSYRAFVSRQMTEMKGSNMTPQQKMKRVAELWKSSKGNSSSAPTSKRASSSSSYAIGAPAGIGKGLTAKQRSKHLAKMIALEKKHHSGKLTAKEHHKLKVYHSLHGSGVLDGGALEEVAEGVKTAIPIVKDVISGIKDIFDPPDPDKQTQRDWMLREYNRVHGTRFGVQGLHYDVAPGN